MTNTFKLEPSESNKKIIEDYIALNSKLKLTITELEEICRSYRDVHYDFWAAYCPPEFTLSLEPGLCINYSPEARQAIFQADSEADCIIKVGYYHLRKAVESNDPYRLKFSLYVLPIITKELNSQKELDLHLLKGQGLSHIFNKASSLEALSLSLFNALCNPARKYFLDRNTTDDRIQQLSNAKAELGLRPIVAEAVYKALKKPDTSFYCLRPNHPKRQAKQHLPAYIYFERKSNRHRYGTIHITPCDSSIDPVSRSDCNIDLFVNELLYDYMEYPTLLLS